MTLQIPYRKVILPALASGIFMFPLVAAGTVNKTFSVSFSGSPVELAGFDANIRLWISIFIIIFIAMYAGASQAPQIAVVDIILAWFFFGIGWLNPLMSGINERYGAGGEFALVILLCFATFGVIVWNFRQGKKNEKGT